MAPRVPVPLREIQYVLSPYQQNVVTQAIRNAPSAAAHFVQEKWLGLGIFSTLLFGTMSYCENYKEQEKLSHRF